MRVALPGKLRKAQDTFLSIRKLLEEPPYDMDVMQSAAAITGLVTVPASVSQFIDGVAVAISNTAPTLCAPTWYTGVYSAANDGSPPYTVNYSSWEDAYDDELAHADRGARAKRSVQYVMTDAATGAAMRYNDEKAAAVARALWVAERFQGATEKSDDEKSDDESDDR